MRMVEKSLLLQVFDQVWKEHLLALDHLRQGIGLRGYGQRDPLNEYKSEAFALFNGMLADLRERRDRPAAARRDPRRPAAAGAGAGAGLRHAPSRSRPWASWRWRGRRPPGTPDYPPMAGAAVPPRQIEGVDPADPSTWGRTPRNAPCPCGSGRKYKHCHGRAD